MTIDDLIKKLYEVKVDFGNIPVKVQCRDEGGAYYGSEDPDLYIADKKDRYAAVDKITLML